MTVRVLNQLKKRKEELIVQLVNGDLDTRFRIQELDNILNVDQLEDILDFGDENEV